MPLTPTPTKPAARAGATDPGGPAICIRCQGAGTVETVTFGVGTHEVRCPGVDGDYSCDGGFVR
jgi:hypothetical protein